MSEEERIIVEEDEESSEDGKSRKPPLRTILLQLTDTHIGGHPLNFRRLRFILDHLYWFYSKETESRIVVVHCGDCVDKGTKPNLYQKCTRVFSDFVNKMKQALGKERFRFFIVVGNHCIGSGVKTELKYYKRFQEAVQPFSDNQDIFFQDVKERGIMCGIEDYGGLRYILLNSMQMVCPGTWANGELGDVQRKWLDTTLENTDGRKALVFLHHHPFKAKSGNLFLKSIMNSTLLHALRDENQFTDVLRKHKSKLLGVIFGHRHWREFVEIEGLNLFNPKTQMKEKQKEEEEDIPEENASKPFLFSGGSTVNGPRMILQHKKVFDEFRFDEKTNEMYERNRWEFKSMYLRGYSAKMFRTQISQRMNGSIDGPTQEVFSISRNFEDYGKKRPKDKLSGVEKKEEKSNSFEKYVMEVEKVIEEEENEGEGESDEESSEEKLIDEFIPSNL